MVGEQNFQAEVLGNDTPVLVDFWAEWCGPCRRIAPIVEELSTDFQGKLKVCKLNVDENPGLAGKYGVMSIPSLIIFKGGEPVERLVGLQPKESLSEKIEAIL